MRKQSSVYRGWKVVVASKTERGRALLAHGVRSKPPHYVCAAEGYVPDLVLEDLHRQIDAIEDELADVGQVEG